jgi:Bacterial sugar transferase
MSGYGGFVRLRLARVATALVEQAPRTGHPVARRFLNYSVPDPECSTAAAPQIRGDAAVLLTMPGWLAVGYPVAVLVALNAGGEHRLHICLRVSDEIPRLAKRAFNFVIGAALLMVCTPPLLLAVVVWLCGGRPVLFRPIRVARAGGLMQIMKLRTTTGQGPDTDWAVPRDQGTRLGRLLRSTHLGDLPQFLNVIRGQMSLIGPRLERSHFYLT